MVARSFTIQLDGAVSLGRLTAALDAWQSALATIAENVGQTHVLDMRVDDLAVGSALVQVRVEFDAEVHASAFSRDYNQVGIQVRDGNVLDFPANLNKPVQALREVALMCDAFSPMSSMNLLGTCGTRTSSWKGSCGETRPRVGRCRSAMFAASGHARPQWMPMRG